MICMVFLSSDCPWYIYSAAPAESNPQWRYIVNYYPQLAMFRIFNSLLHQARFNPKTYVSREKIARYPNGTVHFQHPSLD